MTIKDEELLNLIYEKIDLYPGWGIIKLQIVKSLAIDWSIDEMFLVYSEDTSFWDRVLISKYYERGSDQYAKNNAKFIVKDNFDLIKDYYYQEKLKELLEGK